MPRPPVLPTLDWKAVFDSGLDYSAWLAAAESAEQREQIEAKFQDLALPPGMSGTLAALSRDVKVVAIAEDWCGDVVRHAPVLRRLELACPALSVRYITRQQWPDVFVRFLTNGGEAIPKFIFLGSGWVECGNWGPMPEADRRLIARGKACGDVASARKRVSARYAADPGCREAFEELAGLIQLAACDAP